MNFSRCSLEHWARLADGDVPVDEGVGMWAPGWVLMQRKACLISRLMAAASAVGSHSGTWPAVKGVCPCCGHSEDHITEDRKSPALAVLATALHPYGKSVKDMAWWEWVPTGDAGICARPSLSVPHGRC